MAFGLIQAFNAQHEAGFDLEGNPGGEFFTNLTDAEGAAALIALSENVKDQPSRIAGSTSAAGVPGNNENLKILVDVQNDSSVLELDEILWSMVRYSGECGKCHQCRQAWCQC